MQFKMFLFAQQYITLLRYCKSCMIILQVGTKFFIDITLIMFAPSSLSGEDDSLLAKIKTASAFLICFIFNQIYKSINAKFLSNSNYFDSFQIIYAHYGSEQKFNSCEILFEIIFQIQIWLFTLKSNGISIFAQYLIG